MPRADKTRLAETEKAALSRFQTAQPQRHMSSDAIPTCHPDKVTNKSVRCTVLHTRLSPTEPSVRQEPTSPRQAPLVCRSRRLHAGPHLSGWVCTASVCRHRCEARGMRLREGGTLAAGRAARAVQCRSRLSPRGSSTTRRSKHPPRGHRPPQAHSVTSGHTVGGHTGAGRAGGQRPGVLQRPYNAQDSLTERNGLV